MTDPFTDEPVLPGEPADAMRVSLADGTIHHIPDPGPPSPYMLWQGDLTPEWQAFLRRGNGPYWVEGTTLVISQDVDTEDEDNVRIEKGEWATWLGHGHGFEAGRVMPVFGRVGWSSSEVLLGWIMEPADLPGLFRSMAENWPADTLYEAVTRGEGDE